LLDQSNEVRTPTGSQRSVTLTFACDIKPRPVRWLWKDRAPLGTFGLIAGREGIGKTTCAYAIAADITQGRLSGVYHGEPRTVIVAATEDSWEHTIVPRLLAADADLTRVARVDVTTSDGIKSELSLPRDIDAVAAVCKNHGVALVLLDPMISRLESKLDTHKDADVRRALEPLAHLADTTGAVVLGIIHVNKGASRDPLNMVMGSRAFTAVARFVWFVAEDPENEFGRVLGQSKNNLGRSDLPSLTFEIVDSVVGRTADGDIHTGKLTWTGETERSIRDVVEQAHRGNSNDRTSVDDASEWLHEYLTKHRGQAESALLKSEAKDEGHTESTLKRARQKLGVISESEPGSYPRKTWWLLPGMRLDLTGGSKPEVPGGM
jgi:hypothetical protein